MSEPSCFGLFMKVSGKDCNKCTIRVKCYELFREEEKKLEELKNRQLPWYKRPACVWLERVCETCS